MTTYQYEEFADKHLNIGSKRRNEVLAVCLFHDDHDPSMRFNMDKGVYFCFSCRAAGNIITLARKLGLEVKSNGIIPDLDDPIAELRSFRDGLDTMLNEDDNNEPGVLDETILDRYQRNRDMPFWKSRGITKQSANRWDLGYDSFNQQHIIPLRNDWGRLIGLVRRNPDGTDPKYITPPNYPKNRLLYGSWMFNGDYSDAAVIVEGQIDCIKVWQAGYSALGVMGSGLSRAHVDTLKKIGVREVVLFFDDDKAGFEYAMSAAARLSWHKFRVSAASYDGIPATDPGGMTDEQIVSAVDRAVLL